jgi:NitT/TauT family transport system substrate-binding protein
MSIKITLRACRRSVLAGMTLAGALVGAGSTPGFAADLRIAAIPIVDYAGLWVCVEKGFCQAAGINLQFQTLGGGAAIIAAMKGGSLDLGAVGIVPALRARSAGLDLKFIALASAESNHQEGGPQDIVLVKDPAIKTGKDLEGKTVGVNELRGVGQTWVSAWVAATGGDVGKVMFQEFPVPNLVAALSQGRVDAVQVSEPFRTEGLKQGMTAIPFSEQLQDSIAVAGIVTTEKLLTENEGVMTKFVDAFAKSQEFAATHPAEVRQILAKYTKLGDNAGIVSLATYPTSFHVTDIDFWKTSLNKYGGANISFGFEEMVWKQARVSK